MPANPATTEPAKETLLPEKKDRKRLWCVVRIVDYRLQALAPSDPAEPEADQEWSDLGSDTTISADREAVFQLARSNGGLLMSVNGLPGQGRMAAFWARAKALTEA